MDHTIIERIDEMLTKAKDLSQEDRRSYKRVNVLTRLQKDLNKYRDNLTDMLITIRQMEQALQQEIERCW